MKTFNLALLSVDAASAALPLSFEAIVAICFVSGLMLFAISDYGRKPRRCRFEPSMIGIAPVSTALRLAA